ncbi:unnamed protein product [Camellia sinensis]
MRPIWCSSESISRVSEFKSVERERERDRDRDRELIFSLLARKPKEGSLLELKKGYGLRDEKGENHQKNLSL